MTGINGVLFAMAATAVAVIAGCERAPDPDPQASAAAEAQRPSAGEEPQTDPPASGSTREPTARPEPSLFAAEPGSGPVTEAPPEALGEEPAVAGLSARAAVAGRREGPPAPQLPAEWIERWRDLPCSSISAIANGLQIGQRVRVEGYIAGHGSGPEWGLLYVDFEDHLVDQAARRGRLIALKFDSAQEFTGVGRWTSAVGRVVADPDADPQSPYSALAYLEVEAYLVTDPR